MSGLLRSQYTSHHHPHPGSRVGAEQRGDHGHDDAVSALATHLLLELPAVQLPGAAVVAVGDRAEPAAGRAEVSPLDRAGVPERGRAGSAFTGRTVARPGARASRRAPRRSSSFTSTSSRPRSRSSTRAAAASLAPSVDRHPGRAACYPPDDARQAPCPGPTARTAPRTSRPGDPYELPRTGTASSACPRGGRGSGPNRLGGVGRWLGSRPRREGGRRRHGGTRPRRGCCAPPTSLLRQRARRARLGARRARSWPSSTLTSARTRTTSSRRSATCSAQGRSTSGWCA